jgi:hypothetical protein
MTGLHSPFGMLWQLASTSGYTIKELMWRVSWPMIRLCLADAPRYEPAKNESDKPVKATHGEFLNMAGITPEKFRR